MISGIVGPNTIRLHRKPLLTDRSPSERAGIHALRLTSDKEQVEAAPHNDANLRPIIGILSQVLREGEGYRRVVGRQTDGR